MSDTIRHVTIRGRVQGVGYRAWIEHTATGCNLDGWVRNRRDGSVEAVFSGPAGILAEMVALCRRGPGAAKVDAIDNDEGNSDDLKLRRPGERFSVLPTV